jgi:hypothetical protein
VPKDPLQRRRVHCRHREQASHRVPEIVEADPPDDAHPKALYIYLFASTMALTAFAILTVEFPRAGFLPTRFLDDPLVHLRGVRAKSGNALVDGVAYEHQL